MRRLAVIGLCLVFATGCARMDQKRVISRDLPLSSEDLEEIRAGDDNHRRLFESQNPYQPPEYRVYPSPELHAYVTAVGMRLARVSDRPRLPYRFYIIDSDKVDLFGLGGGRVYVTRGFFTIIESEHELAGGIAHELGHMANFKYSTVERPSKVKKTYNVLMKISSETHSAGGPYGKGIHTGLKAMGTAAPYLKKPFVPNDEKKADQDAIRYMIKAGYDPRGLEQLVEKLAIVEVEEVDLYVDYMRSHPPFVDRRKALAARIKKTDFKKIHLEKAERIESFASYVDKIQIVQVKADVR